MKAKDIDAYESYFYILKWKSYSEEYRVILIMTYIFGNNFYIVGNKFVNVFSSIRSISIINVTVSFNVTIQKHKNIITIWQTFFHNEIHL